MRARKAALKTVDHRTTTGAERRDRTRSLLIECALPVFGRRGVDKSVIDELVKVAGVSRGTFYNYFRTNEELLAAVAMEVGKEVMLLVDPVVVELQTDPAARVAIGAGLCLAVARKYPIVAAFSSRGGAAVMTANPLVTEYIPRDLAAGMATGRFAPLDPRLAFDLVIGPLLAAFNTFVTMPVPDSYARGVVQGILQSLGVSKAAAHKISGLPLPKIEFPQESIIVRTQVIARTSGSE